VLLRAVEAGGGLARFVPLPPDAAAWLGAARALPCGHPAPDPVGAAIHAPAASGEWPEGAGAPARAGHAAEASGAGTSVVLAAAGVANDPAASASGAAEPCALSAAWPDLSDAALLAWPVGRLAAAGHLAGVRSRAQLQRIDWAAVLRCTAQPFASLAVDPGVRAFESVPSAVYSTPDQICARPKRTTTARTPPKLVLHATPQGRARALPLFGASLPELPGACRSACLCKPVFGVWRQDVPDGRTAACSGPCGVRNRTQRGHER